MFAPVSEEEEEASSSEESSQGQKNLVQEEALWADSRGHGRNASSAHDNSIKTKTPSSSSPSFFETGMQRLEQMLEPYLIGQKDTPSEEPANGTNQEKARQAPRQLQQLQNHSTTKNTAAQDVCTPFNTQGETLQRGNHTGIVPINRLVDGNGLTNVTGSKGMAICALRLTSGMFILPHHFQQIYRCFSFWMLRRAEPYNQQPVMFKWKPPKLRNLYHKAAIRALQDVWNITVVYKDPELDALPKVQAIVSERYPYTPRGAGHGMHHPNDFTVYRDDLLRHYKLHNTHTIGGCPAANDQKKKQPVIGILNRKETRGILNHVELQSRLKQEFEGATVKHFYMEGKSYLEQVGSMAEIDLLLTPHGAQETSLPFLPECASVLEFYPAGYMMSYFYGSLANASGVGHYYLYVGDSANKTEDLARSARIGSVRDKARRKHICLPLDITLESVHTMVREWHACCQQQNQQQ